MTSNFGNRSKTVWGKTVVRNKRQRKNPLGRITPKDARDILAEMKTPGADFHALRSHDVAVLLDHAKHFHYRAPKNASGSKARSFYAYLERLAGRSTRKNPVIARTPYLLELLHRDYGVWYIKSGPAGHATMQRGLAREYPTEQAATRDMKKQRDAFPLKVRNKFAWMRTVKK
jgi:hypothetical protein